MSSFSLTFFRKGSIIYLWGFESRMKAAKVEVKIGFTTEREDSALTLKKISADDLLALLVRKIYFTISESYIFDRLV